MSCQCVEPLIPHCLLACRSCWEAVNGQVLSGQARQEVRVHTRDRETLPVASMTAPQSLALLVECAMSWFSAMLHLQPSFFNALCSAIGLRAFLGYCFQTVCPLRRCGWAYCMLGGG